MPEAQGGYNLDKLALFVESGRQTQGILEVQSPDSDTQDFKLGVVNLTQEATSQGRLGKSVSYPEGLFMDKLRVQAKKQGPYKPIVKQSRYSIVLECSYRFKTGCSQRKIGGVLPLLSPDYA